MHKRLANVIAGHDKGIDIVISGELGHPRNSRAQAPCEELLHTFTTKICTHNKNPVGSGTTMWCSLTSKVVRGK